MAIPINRNSGYRDGRKLCPFYFEKIVKRKNPGCRSCGPKSVRMSLCKKLKPEKACMGLSRCNRLDTSLKEKILQKWKKVK